MAVAWLNLVFAAVAVVVNIWAAVWTHTLLRLLFISIATLALIYAVSFVWLVTHYVDAGEWSQFMRPFGMVAWLVAWVAPQVVIVRYIRNQADRLLKEAECLVAQKTMDSA